MGNCASGKRQTASEDAEDKHAQASAQPVSAQPSAPAGGSASASASAAARRTAPSDAPAPATADSTPSDVQKLEVRTHVQASSTASSEVGGARPRQDSSFERTGAASSEDLRTPHDYTSSPQSSLRRVQQSSGTQQPRANPALTESALLELNQASSTRRGQPSSTGGTTANTRPTEAHDLPELSDVPEAASEVPMSPGGDASTGDEFRGDAPAATPPPVAEGLPVVSLQDIAVMEQKQGRRGRRMRSRRGSTTASHASLTAIPENVEITPLHARSERSDSMRVGPMGAHPVSRLADVQELDVRAVCCCMPAGLYQRLSQLALQQDVPVTCSLASRCITAGLLPGRSSHHPRAPC
jgi:hypothetical protein